MGFFDRVKAAANALLGRSPEPQAPQQPTAAPAVDPGMPELNLPHVSGWKGGRIVTTKSADVAMQTIRDAASEGRRVSFNVHDNNGWHQLYKNEQKSVGRHKPSPGISASELQKRFDTNGVPGAQREQVRQQREQEREQVRQQREQALQERQQRAQQREQARQQREAREAAERQQRQAPPVQQPPVAQEKQSIGDRVKGFFGKLFGRGGQQQPAAPPPQPPQPSEPTTQTTGGIAPEPGGDDIAGDRDRDEFPDEEEEEEPWEDFPDDWDEAVGDSESGDDETEGYDTGSVSGYQIVVYY